MARGLGKAPGWAKACGPSRRSLAGGATKGRAVHEALPPDRRVAPRTGPTFLTVSIQGPREVARLAIDVDVERVEAGASLIEGRRHHRRRRVENGVDLDPAKSGARPLAVDTGGPQCLVGIDVAHPGEEPLVEQ